MRAHAIRRDEDEERHRRDRDADDAKNIFPRRAAHKIDDETRAKQNRHRGSGRLEDKKHGHQRRK